MLILFYIVLFVCICAMIKINHTLDALQNPIHIEPYTDEYVLLRGVTGLYGMGSYKLQTTQTSQGPASGDDQVCRKCTGVTCPETYVRKADYANLVGSNIAECCILKPMCSPTVRCPYNYNKKLNYDNLEGSNITECCDPKPMCNQPTVRCPATHVPKSEYNVLVGSNVSECCDLNPISQPLCRESIFICPEGYTPKGDFIDRVGSNVDECCNPIISMCTGVTCTPGVYTQKANYINLVGSNVSECCNPVPKCADFTCPSEYTWKANYINLVGSNVSQCCNANPPSTNLCSSVAASVCPTGKNSAVASFNALQTECCNPIPKCANFRCDLTTHNPKADLNIIGNSVRECCDPKPTCGQPLFSCPPTYVLKSNHTNIVGNSISECCDPPRLSTQCEDELARHPDIIFRPDIPSYCESACSLKANGPWGHNKQWNWIDDKIYCGCCKLQS
jgi:hypothetical protein